MSGASRERLLLCARLLWEKSDPEHPLTAAKLIASVEEAGLACERKSLYRDIAALRQAGMDIRSGRGRAAGYYVNTRLFEPAELTLLADAVEASRSVSRASSRTLTQKLQKLTSVYRAKALSRRLYLSGRPKTDNEALFYNLDTLHEAIDKKRKITFQYLEYAPDKTLRPRRGGQRYSVSPYLLCWDDENYYLAAYHDRYGGLSNFRVDKMRLISITGEPARECAEDVRAYASRSFGMFAGQVRHVEIELPASSLGVLIDRFGSEAFITPLDNGRLLASFDAAVSPVFFSFVFMLPQCRITHPEDVRLMYKQRLEETLKMQKSEAEK